MEEKRRLLNEEALEQVNAGSADSTNIEFTVPDTPGDHPYAPHIYKNGVDGKNGRTDSLDAEPPKP